MDSVIVERSFGSVTSATKEEDGTWKVIVRMYETRTAEGGEQETQEIKAQCTNDSFADAYEVAISSVIAQFNDRIAETKTNSLFEERKEE